MHSGFEPPLYSLTLDRNEVEAQVEITVLAVMFDGNLELESFEFQLITRLRFAIQKKLGFRQLIRLNIRPIRGL